MADSRKRAARSKNTVAQSDKRAAAAKSSLILQRMSGRSAADISEGATAKGLLQAAYGRGPRGGAVNARKAAEALGVAPSTVRRWAAGTQRPTKEHQGALEKSARRATRTKSGRRAATTDLRASSQGQRMLRGGAKLWVSGNQGVIEAGEDYRRDRRVGKDIAPSDIEDMFRAYEEGGDSGLHEWIEDFLDKNYVPGWSLESIDDFSFGNPG